MVLTINELKEQMFYLDVHSITPHIFKVNKKKNKCLKI